MSSRRKVQMSMMWKDRRRSPRISGMNLCAGASESQQQMVRVKVDSSSSTTKQSTANASAAAAAAAAGVVRGVNGPASRTRVRKKRKLKPLQDVAATTCASVSPIAPQESEDGDRSGMEDDEEENLEAQQSVTEQPPQHDDSHQDQSSSMPSSTRMPEKRILQLILDILQRKDTHEIFAEPVDPEEVEDYYEIIKEPMDFGTMRAKLHEGMYTSLEQFEHDAFLISGNAMHFNSSGTIYFRQARTIHELSKRVFHALKADPDNFESEFSEMRRRTRRPQAEAKGPISSSSPKPATNFRSNNMNVNVSSKAMPYSQSGATTVRRNSQRNLESSSAASTLTTRETDMLPGSTCGKRTNFSEADLRSTYNPWPSIFTDKDSTVSLIDNCSKTLHPMNQQDMGYKESLMSFVKGLGPTAQMIAKRKLHGWSMEASRFRTLSSNCSFQSPQCHNPPAFPSVRQRQTALDNNFGTMMSQNPLHQQLFQHRAITGNSSVRTVSGDSDIIGDRKNRRAASVEVEPLSGMKKDPHVLKADNCTGNALMNSGNDKVHKNSNNMIMLSSNSSSAADRDLNFSVSGLKDTGMSETLVSDKHMLDNQGQSLKSTSDFSQSELLKFSLRNNYISSSSWPLQPMNISTSETNGSTNNLGSQYLIHNDQALTAQCQSARLRDSSGSNEALKSSHHPPLLSQFTFSLPYLKTRLDQITTSAREKSLQPTGRSFMDRTSNQNLDNQQQQQPSLDSKHTDLLLQL